MNIKTKQTGFTLAEVLVALFIFAIISSASVGLLANSIRAKQSVREASDKIQAISLSRILLREDLANMIEVKRIDNLGEGLPFFFAGGQISDGILFNISRTNNINPGGVERRSNLQNISWYLTDKTLTRQSLPRLNTFDKNLAQKQKLLKNIEYVNLRFFDGIIWSDTWPARQNPDVMITNNTNMPKLVMFEIVFSDNKKIKHVFKVGADQ